MMQRERPKRDPLMKRTFRKRSCFFCENKTNPDYKDKAMDRYISDRGKILPQRYTGTCTLHQRRVARAVKQARHLALLPFVSENLR